MQAWRDRRTGGGAETRSMVLFQRPVKRNQRPQLVRRVARSASDSVSPSMTRATTSWHRALPSADGRLAAEESGGGRDGTVTGREAAMMESVATSARNS